MFAGLQIRSSTDWPVTGKFCRKAMVFTQAFLCQLSPNKQICHHEGCHQTWHVASWKVPWKLRLYKKIIELRAVGQGQSSYFAGVILHGSFHWFLLGTNPLQMDDNWGTAMSGNLHMSLANWTEPPSSDASIWWFHFYAHKLGNGGPFNLNHIDPPVIKHGNMAVGKSTFW